METPSTVSKTPRVPRYVRDLNGLAEVHGIATSTLFGPGDNNPETRLWAKWTGTCHQLQSVGLLARHQQARLMWSSPHLRRHTLTVPSSERWWCNPLLQGEIEVTADLFVWHLDFGSGEFSVADRGWGDVEAVTYANEVRLYGSAEALVRAGVDRARLPLGMRAAKSGYSVDEPWWYSRRVPSGLHLYRFETGKLFRSGHSPEHRASARPLRTDLRLVVDNTARGRERND